MSAAPPARRPGRVAYDSYGEPIFELTDDPELNEQPGFGLLFDIDGVLGRGANVFPQAQEAFKLLCDPDGTELRVPVAFVTNACGNTLSKVERLSRWFNVEIDPEQLIQAPSPLTVFQEYHKKRVLVIGQENVLEIAHELGFLNAVCLDDVRAAYPLLDMVDHANRRRMAKIKPVSRAMEPIETIILLGEPTRWESNLQLLIDLLMTNGKPDHVPTDPPEEHIPVIACNMDLVYMDQAALPRFGHGAFLACLQALYRQFTGRKLQYTSLLGKPSEITFRFAEHTLALMAKRMGYKRTIDRLYFFGDNPDVDILGSNLYNNFLRRFRHFSGGDKFGNDEHVQRVSVSQSRTMPPQADLLPQTARGIDAILVQTGVYSPKAVLQKRKTTYCHRDFQGATDLVLPTFEVANCLEGIQMVLEIQNFHPSKRHVPNEP
ncbi:Haloacid dehalogenase-like hydrolase domain-containing 5 [Clonorchis sinensis]|uniref:Haloacid dehalogenase-like hydrolase domain-containing 5 n=2 Tax=Clonorchis sinensis TaxID=79923 RepID=A0A8T1MLV6_CLOSI|nr:Haloacid dehalogenase-like hydrolase domain-containing 5 [Clonorchis sinensis]GAA47299.1 cat eye syndrome critical region protein 5 [Clonorchis sinensis]